MFSLSDKKKVYLTPTTHYSAIQFADINASFSLLSQAHSQTFDIMSFCFLSGWVDKNNFCNVWEMIQGAQNIMIYQEHPDTAAHFVVCMQWYLNLHQH